MRKNMKKHAKLVAAVTMAASIIGASSVFALNTNGNSSEIGNKPFSFAGYTYQDNGGSADTLQLNFNKDMASPAEVLTTTDWAKVITVTDEFDGDVPFTVSSVTGGSNYDDGNHYTKGTRVVLSFTNELDAEATYTVTINNNVINNNGISLGNYNNRHDISFVFKTPIDGTTTWTNEVPTVTYLGGNPDTATSDSLESDMILIFDRPFKQGDATALSTFEGALNGISAAGGYNKSSDGSSWSDVNFQSTGTTGDCYTIKHNDALTTFFFPMTINSSTLGCFNRTNNYYYQVNMATFVDTSNRSWDPASYTYGGDGNSYQIHTLASGDYPAWLCNANPNVPLTKEVNGLTTKIKWHNLLSGASQTASTYEVWYTTGDKLSGTYTQIGSGSITYTDDDSGYMSASFTTPGSATYYRLVPTGNSLEAGFSIATE